MVYSITFIYHGEIIGTQEFDFILNIGDIIDICKTDYEVSLRKFIYDSPNEIFVYLKEY
jgi:hypothetical protein